METLNEKKWFVYLGDHHEGPFSAEEIAGKMNSGVVTEQTFVWCDGMSDWKVMTEVNELYSFISSGGQPTVEAIEPEPQLVPGLESTAPVPAEVMPMEVVPAEVMAAEPTATIMVSPSKGTSSAILPGPQASAIEMQEAPVDDKTTEISPRERKKAEKERRKAEKRNAKDQKKKDADLAAMGLADRMGPSVRGGERLFPKLIRLLLYVAIAGGTYYAYREGHLDPVLKNPEVQKGFDQVRNLVRPYMGIVTENVPALSRWVSPIRPLDDVRPESYEKLKSAAWADLSTGPSLAVAAGAAESTEPVIYVAGNLPGGTAIDVFVLGVEGTLLNQLDFFTKLQGKIENGVASTGVIRGQDGTAIPRGEYFVVAMESKDGQPPAALQILEKVPPSTMQVPELLPSGRKVVAKETVFLGGKQDEMYQSRLKLYHDKLREKARNELGELKQFAMTLITQFNSSVKEFDRLSGGRLTPQVRGKWKAFHSSWDRLRQQIQKSFGQWSPEQTRSQFFYSVAYDMLKGSGALVFQVHDLHNAYFNDQVDRKAFASQRNALLSQAQMALSDLKAKIDHLESAPPLPSGMPRRN